MTTVLDTTSIHPAVNNSQCDMKCYMVGSLAILAYITANYDVAPNRCLRIACYAHPPFYQLFSRVKAVSV